VERLRNSGGLLTIPCQGSLIIPSGNIDTLPLVNEFNLDPRRLTTAQSPLGGVNGLVDYAPGSVHVTDGDGIYLTDVAGNNTSKDLPAGLLSRLGYLTIGTVAHTIKEEFIVVNTATSNNPTVIDACNSATGWSQAAGTITTPNITSNGTSVTASGSTSSGGYAFIQKTIPGLNISSLRFARFTFRCSVNCTMYFKIGDSDLNYAKWDNKPTLLTVAANTDYQFVLPYIAPSLSVGSNPTNTAGSPNFTNGIYLNIGIKGANSTPMNFMFGAITADTGKQAYIEIAIPDNLADTSLVSQKWNGSAYETNRIVKLDTVATVVSSDTTKMVFGDQTKFDDVFGLGLGRSNFPKGVSGQTVNGSLAGTTMTYSAIRGTKNRIGLRVDLPPSDGGRTAFNQCRIKKIIYYTDVNKASNILPDISGNGNNGTMSMVSLTADNLGNPCGAMSFNGVSSYVDCGTNITPLSTITICGYAKTSVTTSPIQWIAGRGDSGNIGWKIYFTSGTVVTFAVGNGTSVSAVNKANAINTWCRFVATYDGINIKLYINGVVGTPNALTGNIDYTGVPNTWIGQIQGAGGTNTRFLNGCLNDLRVYSRAWSQAEVTADYNNQLVSSTGLVAQWQPSTVAHMGQSTQELSNDNNASTGLLNIAKPWLAIIDPTTKQLDYYLFTERPTSLSYKRDESGNVYEVVVNPGNGLVYKGSTVWANNTLDTNTDSKPDMLDSTIQNSIAQMLSVYGFNR